MWLIIIFVIVAFAGFGIFFWILKSKSENILHDIRSCHNINLSYVNSSGYVAFADDEKILFYFNTTSHDQLQIKYKDIISFDRYSATASSIVFGVITSNLERHNYDFGSRNEDQFIALQNKFDSIIKGNLDASIKEYEAKISIPPDAIIVTVKEYNGMNAIVPSRFALKDNNTFFWTDGQKVYLMSKFGGLSDYKMNPSAYNPIIIDRQNIVELVHEGDVYYTTQVRGGGGGGSSIKGAVIGGMIAGEAGAIIGSRKPTESITSTTNKIDDRATYMKVLNSTNNFYEIVFGYNDYYAISKLIGK